MLAVFTPVVFVVDSSQPFTHPVQVPNNLEFNRFLYSGQILIPVEFEDLISFYLVAHGIVILF